ncbi:MAG: AmmeMemoRadiSam system radical SAM enzyme [Deltaproteobacteria bacterium]|nr:AmmeMemoRadiSam system radical SAM enzyme [Deltaproteobacteria bacterium]
MNRRALIKGSLLACAAAASPRLFEGRLLAAPRQTTAGDDEKFVREAAYWKKLTGTKVECELCPRACKVADGERGFCGVRENRGGRYVTLVFNRPCSMHVDPIEKKPLFHYKPGTRSFSIATAGCNVECKFCQNWEISQFRPEQIESIHQTPDDIVEGAIRSGSATIAFTYTEPVVYCEYMLAVAERAREKGVEGVMITNAFIKEKPLLDTLKVLGAIKVDFKGYTEDFYKTYCRGELKPVLEAMKRIAKAGTWLELVHLTIPTLNDDEKVIRQLAVWVKDNLGPKTPIHFTRFHPMYKLKNLPVTPVKTLERARDVSMDAGLKYVYAGNVPGHPGENTYCHKCGRMLIKRAGYIIKENLVQNGKCPCGEKIPGVWS